MPINSFLYPAKNVPVVYDVANSSRWDNASSMKMTRTPSGDGNLDRWTWSFWIKLGKIGTEYVVFHAFGASAPTETFVKILSGSAIEFSVRVSGTYVGRLITNRLLRDPTGWMHLCFVMDTPNSTAGDRMIIYVNGVRETSFSTETYPDQNQDTTINDASFEHTIGSYGSGNYFDGYMAEVVLLDGTAASITDFGEFDEDTPTIWKPKDPSGLTFGTNGFYLNFEDSSNLGNDANGGQDWTEVNFDATDQATDTCTNNFATINPLYNATSSPFTFSQGNCEVEQNTTNWRTAAGTVGVSSGKWYFEAKGGQGTNGYTHYGWSSNSWLTEKGVGSMYEPTTNHNGPSVTYYGYNGNNYYSTSSATGSTASYGATFNHTNTIGCFLDLDNNKAYWSKDGTLQNSGTGYSIESGFTWFPIVGGFDMDNGGESVKLNFGGCPATTISSGNTDPNGYGNFEYSTTITGDSASKSFYAINTKNLSEFG